jgi:plasmid stabilization system protein ParE
MVKRIEWTQTALVELGQVLNYLKNEVSIDTAIIFSDLLKKKIKNLETNKIEGRLVPTKKTIRFILLGKHHRIYYRRHGLTLFITRIFDTRQDPKKRPY